MVLVKIGRHIGGENSHSEHISYRPDVDSMEREEWNDAGADSQDNSNDFILADVGCELGIVEGQVCSIPYELYDLPDLKEILSLKTWNSCLSEEERFSLSAYLPDMDQHTFQLTMKELLSGDDMSFGNPLSELFERLKGGFYPPKVAHLREGLKFLQERKFYYSLRSYHENMYQTFLHMKRIWDQCQLSITAEDRVHIWKRRMNQKGIDSIDLNVYPTDGDPLGEEETNPLLKKTKGINHKEAKAHILFPSIATGMKFVPPNNGAKGVLKIKSAGTNSFQTGVAKGVQSYSRDQYRPSPKGVLKIIPKGSFIERPRVVPVQTEPSPLIEATVSQPFRYSPFQASPYSFDARNLDRGLPFLHHKVDGRKAYTSSEPPDCIMDRQRVEFFNGTARQSRKAKKARDLSFHPITNLQEHNLFGDESSLKGGHGSSSNSFNVRKYVCDDENLWQNVSGENGGASQISMEPYPFTTEYYQGEQLMIPISDKNVPMIPLHSQASLDEMKRHRDVNDEESQRLYEKATVFKGLQDGLELPITYKRRKAQSKFNSVEIFKPLKETNPTLVEIGRSIKINFKNGRDFSK